MTDILKKKLQTYLNTSKIDEIEKTNKEKKEEEENLFKFFYNSLKNDESESSFGIIPKFYSQLPSESDILQTKLREEARASFLQRKSKELLDNEELQHLWTILENIQSTPPSSPPSSPPPLDPQLSSQYSLIDYHQFKKASEIVPPKCKQFFKPSIFSRLQNNIELKKNKQYKENKEDEEDEEENTEKSINTNSGTLGLISSSQFFNYIMRKVWLHQTRIGLSIYDSAGLGFLRENDMESYILELIPTLTQLDKLNKSFYSFYVCTAVRKFFFFLDPLRTGKIKIQDILSCGMLDKLLELREENMTTEQQQLNWFSSLSTLKVYGQYLQLDTNHNGMLSKDELSKIANSSFTEVFMDRVFQECLTYENEIDFKTYLDFVLALQHRVEPQSIQFLFRIIDSQHKGFLNVFDLHFFYKSILKCSLERNLVTQEELVAFEDIRNEIFDMVKPIDPLKITCSDLLNSGNADIVISLLIDVNFFWNYENREIQVPSSDANQKEN